MAGASPRRPGYARARLGSTSKLAPSAKFATKLPRRAPAL